MASVLSAVRNTAALSIALLLALTIPVDAGQATFVSGEAANAMLSHYRVLESQNVFPPLGNGALPVSVTIQESQDSFSIVFNASEPSGRQTASTARGALTGRRSSAARAAYSELESGSKELGPAPTTALLNALDFAERHPSARQAVRDYAAVGYYVVRVWDVGTRYLFVGLSYPSPYPAGTVIGCNPMRELRYDTTTGAIAEVHPPC